MAAPSAAHRRRWNSNHRICGGDNRALDAAHAELRAHRPPRHLHPRHPDPRPSGGRSMTTIDFAHINRAALGALPALLERWLPNGKRRGREYIARNPTRDDRTPGSFSINLKTGRWSDFATGDTGADVINLYAYLRGIRQGEAARELARILRVEP